MKEVLIYFKICLKKNSFVPKKLLKQPEKIYYINAKTGGEFEEMQGVLKNYQN